MEEEIKDWNKNSLGKTGQAIISLLEIVKRVDKEKIAEIIANYEFEDGAKDKDILEHYTETAQKIVDYLLKGGSNG